MAAKNLASINPLDGRAEAEKCASACDYYASHAERFLAPEPAATEARDSFVAFNPLGVVLAVMPWNFPFWQVFRCAAAIEDAFLRAGFPAGLFRNLPVSGERVSGILADARVRAVTLTGSVEAGRSVAARAGALLKKSVLELGGSDPYLILADADVDLAADELEAGNCFVNGLVRSDPRLPFGGIKESGYGRELSAFGIREFVNVKTVYAE